MPRHVLVLAALILAACTTPPPPQTAGAKGAEPSKVAVAAPAVEQAEPGEIAVTSTDVTWGDATAPVTIVMFADFECRHCGAGARTMEALKEHYGPQKLRVAFKHLPLDIHDRAYAIAVFAESLRARSGDEAFWKFYRRVFLERQESESPADAIGRALVDLGPEAQPRTGAAITSAKGAAKVDADIELAEKLRIRGTPAFFVNGLPISGAQPIDVFEEAIDDELALAAEAAKEGVPASRIYAVRTEENLKAARAAAKRELPPPPEDLTVWYAPVDKSPTRGDAKAPVTIVMFSDFECPFCAKAQKTITQVEEKYGKSVRVVFKHNPLPFHKGAEPAAELVQEVFAKKGAAAFWKAHDALYAVGRSLDEADLEAIAEKAGLDAKATMKAVRAKKHTKRIHADQELAADLEADGTPTFFVNGRRITGARSLDEFSRVIDERLAAAKKLTDAGTAPGKVYDEVMRTAKRTVDVEKGEAPPRPKGAPARGTGPVVVQVFSDFECPFCRRHAATLEELEKELPGKLTIVWRHLPLPMHDLAWPAAAAALEVKVQKGDAAFWKMHDRIFAVQTERELDAASLEAAATELGADASRLRAAIEKGTHDAAIKADVEAAKKLGVEGTPGTFVDGYFVSGAVPAHKLKRVVRRALADRGIKN